MNNPYAGASGHETEMRAVAQEMAKRSAQKEAERRERQQLILDYYRHRK